MQCGMEDSSSDVARAMKIVRFRSGSVYNTHKKSFIGDPHIKRPLLLPKN